MTPPSIAQLLRRAGAAAALAAAAVPAAAQDTVVVSVDSGFVETVSTNASDVRAVERPAWAGRARVSPLLAPDHWAVRAAERAEALGLAPEYFPAQRAVPRHAVGRALEAAVERAEAGRSELAPLARGWLARFREEFPADAVRAGAVRPLSRAVHLGYRAAEDRLSPAIGYAGLRTEPLELDDERGVAAALAGAVGLGRWGLLSAEGRSVGDDAGLWRWEAAAGAGAWALSVGRADVAYGYGRGGAIVLSPREPLPRAEVRTTRPVRLPWVLGALGPVTVHTFAGPAGDDERHPTDPWLWGARVAARPHPRLELAVNRASIFGGEGRPATVRNVGGMLVGAIRSDFENQVVSAEARWRLPTDAVLPATVYLEWGADDGAGAVSEQPAALAGVFFPALPGLPQVALGAEYAKFAACCGHGAWYTNATFPGNWARGTQGLGHPLGGEGWEALGYARAELLGARLRLDARAFVRERSASTLPLLGGGNLFTPAWTGRSTGGALDAALRVGRRADVRAGYFRDGGDGWTEQAFHAGGAVFF